MGKQRFFKALKKLVFNEQGVGSGQFPLYSEKFHICFKF